jgi:Tol biopolymer transport system component/DNA-binding winged helix-turn-helix (wHTH) protein
VANFPQWPDNVNESRLNCRWIISEHANSSFRYTCVLKTASLVSGLLFEITETSRLTTVVEEPMASSTSSSPVQRFGGFEVDPRSRELRRKGIHIRMQDQPLEILLLLIERRGEVVTREELKARLWPAGTFVAADDGINTAIRKLREVLGDSAEGPIYIETIPRRGYRFIGPVEDVGSRLTATPSTASGSATVATGGETATAGVPRGGVRTFRRRWMPVGGLAAATVIALGAFVVYRWPPKRPPEEGVLTAVPFTALPGTAKHPAFSPDGSRIVFAWSPRGGGTGSGKYDLYVKALGSETLLRLTQHPSASLTPAWSPDGTQIAFYRLDGAESGIYVVPALGGSEQKLRSTRDFWRAAISWSADGKWIAFGDESPDRNHIRTYLLSPETLATMPTPINPTCVEERQPAFSHDGKYLAYWCFRNDYQAQLYFFSLPDGKPKVIAPFWEDLPTGLTWSADDTKLIYSRSKNYESDELFELSVATGSTKQLGLTGHRPAVSPKGDKVAYGAVIDRSNIWRRELLHPEAPPLELIPSSRAQYDAQYSSEGKRIAFTSHRSGLQGVWISNEDGSNLVQISDPNVVSGNPQWSPDGTKVAFDSFPRDTWEIYVADVSERKPRKLVTNISSIIRPSWSLDGKSIYFVSEERGREGIYRCSASGGEATQLSKDIHASNPKESSDGKTLYFASYAGTALILKKVALAGQPGAESEVDPLLHVRDWLLSPDGIYFVQAEAPRSIRYFEFATRQIRTIFEVDRDLNTGLSISPDGRWILYSQEGDATGDIMLVDHFR